MIIGWEARRPGGLEAGRRGGQDARRPEGKTARRPGTRKAWKLRESAAFIYQLRSLSASQPPSLPASYFY